jgi:hypothetical protein
MMSESMVELNLHEIPIPAAVSETIKIIAAASENNEPFSLIR